jgi:hypothetical protein
MRHHRRRNPGGIRATFGNLSALAVDAAWAIGGGVVTRSLPESVLPNQNQGWMGYGLNILTAAVGSALVTKFTKNARAGGMFLVGGIVMTVGRVVEDTFGYNVVQFAALNPMATPMLSGDAAYSLAQRRRLSGTYQPAEFPLPTNSLLPAASAAAPVVANALSGPWRGAWN